MHSLAELCRQNPGRVALPESFEPRTLAAAVDVLREGSCKEIVLFGPPDKIRQAFAAAGIGLSGIDPHAIRWAAETSPKLAGTLTSRLVDQARAKGRQIEVSAVEQASDSPLLQAGELLYEQQVDTVVAGAQATTAEVIRAAISAVGLAPGCRTVSGAFLMLRPAAGGTPMRTDLFADCGVVIEPTKEQLCDIAAATARTWHQIISPVSKIDSEPVVAFLSFSTKGSASHPAAQKVQDAYQLFKTRFPRIIADGELQFDAAFLAEIGQRKAPGSLVPGRTNCFIFPSLDAGNISYKIAQRLGNYMAIGPILQGLALPYSDLSRGASVSDIAMAIRVNLLRSRFPAVNLAGADITGVSLK